jgi:hypothetical protein
VASKIEKFIMHEIFCQNMYSFLLAIFSSFDIVMHFVSGSSHSESNLKDKEAESSEHA